MATQNVMRGSIMKSSVMRYVLDEKFLPTTKQETIEIDLPQIKDTVAENLAQFGEAALMAALTGSSLNVKHQAYARTFARKREQIAIEVDGKPSYIDGKLNTYEGAYVNDVLAVQAYAPTIVVEYGENRGMVEQEIDKRVEALEPAERTLKALRKIEKDVRAEVKKAKALELQAAGQAKSAPTESPTGNVRKAAKA